MFETNLKIGFSTMWVLFSAAFALAQNPTPTPDLETLLKNTNKQVWNYSNEFKNLLAEETKTFELFDGSGQVKKRTVVESNFMIFQSLKDENVSSEYRGVVKVDGKAVGDTQKRSTDLFEQLAKAKSVKQELEKIQNESLRYDKHLEINGLTLFQTPILSMDTREFVDFKFLGIENFNGANVFVVEYRQAKPSPYIRIDEKGNNNVNALLSFSLDLPKPLDKSNVFLRGKLWIDAQTFQIRREERELVTNVSNNSTPIVVFRDEYDYQPSDFGILVPMRIVYSYFKVKSKDKGANISANLDTKATFEYRKFRKSRVEIKIDDN
jgi:hypothetical protein